VGDEKKRRWQRIEGSDGVKKRRDDDEEKERRGRVKEDEVRA
jgi:hypothetical protein